MILVMNDSAPGHPGIPPRWTSSDKSGIGTAINAQSRVWFTASHGIINEVYYPSIDRANTRDFGFVVTDGASFFSEERKLLIMKWRCSDRAFQRTV